MKAKHRSRISEVAEGVPSRGESPIDVTVSSVEKKKADVPVGYRCPFCADHEDDEFYHSDLIGRPLCADCHEELNYLLIITF